MALALAATACEPAPPAPAPVVAADSMGMASPLPPDTVDVQGVTEARAVIAPVGDGEVEGAVTFTRVAGGVRVHASLEGLSASDFHALQVLRGRDCDADPTVHLGAEAGAPHGGPYSPPGLRHAGDLGNVRGDDGDGRYDRIDPELSLDGTASLVGRAVVLRAGRDDAASPDGAAGDVIGCGIAERVR
ncbi:hypothetical protein BSZ37_17365 [Rubrivirga marina]|uniref:Superoxide dismutase copper/zinc binding domain-containing protein n=1 Tax=Rubrivirga marina TaxID=1196024 RepID=A0A271J462_9BACT|nr:hypothetical protein BSZ37_17365 [Rubrivirga marina]